MKTLKTILTAVVALVSMPGAVLAQTATPLTTRDVVGEWTLTVTPSDRQDVSIRIESADGGPTVLPLSIMASRGDAPRCRLRGDPADCRIRDGKLIVTMPGGSGGARMTFTLADRTPGGFSGSAHVRVRLLPMIGGQIGSVDMIRR